MSQQEQSTSDDGPVDDGLLAGARYPDPKAWWDEEERRPGYCPVCRFNYVPSIESNRRQHRSRHNQWMKPRRPKPDPRFAADTDVMVDKASPKWLHKLVYERAQALKRDQRYDFVQWGEDHAPRASTPGGRLHAILLIENSTAVGVAGFEFVNWSNKAPGWHMVMVWIAEPWRRKGVLSRRWARWRETYGEFTVEKPISEAMADFLSKQEASAADQSRT